MNYFAKFVLLPLMSLFMIASLIACNPSGAGDEPDLDGTSWILQQFGPAGAETAVLPNAALTLNFDGDQINGHAGCNSYFAEVTIGTDGRVTFGMMGSTLMACADEAMMQQESAFWATLAQANRYTVAGNQLTLHTPDGSLTFVAATSNGTSN